MKPIPLTAPDGTICMFICGVCFHAPTLGTYLVAVELGHFADESQKEAEACCRCRDCNAPVEARHFQCPACRAAFEASLPLPDPNECQGIECVIGRGKCHVCGTDWSKA